MEEIQRICANRGIIFPTAEIYSTISGFFEFGPVGTLLKRKFIEYWREFFVKSEDNIFEIDGCTVLPEKVFIASILRVSSTLSLNARNAKGFIGRIS
jgi:glycyl-tRNA synthetase